MARQVGRHAASPIAARLRVGWLPDLGGDERIYVALFSRVFFRVLGAVAGVGD